MKKQRRGSAEKGQAMVLMVLAMVGLLGLAGVAIDGGNAYTQKRRGQNAVDNAVLAYALRLSQTSDVNLLNGAATDVMAANGYVDGQNGVTIVINRPPTQGAYQGNMSYVEGFLTAPVNTNFIHLVYPGPVEYTVRAVAYGASSVPLMTGYAIAAMNPGVCNGNDFTGRGGGANGGTTLHNAGAFVNSSCPGNALNMTGNDNVSTDDGSFPLDVVGGVSGTACTDGPPNAYSPAGCNYWPAPTTGVPAQPQGPIEGTPAAIPPPCGPVRNLATELASLPISPGTYASLDPGSSFGQTMTMEPGVYCLTGSGKVSAGKNGIQGDEVLIYIVAQGGKVDFSGQGTVDLTAPTAATCATIPDVCNHIGILIYKITGYNTCSDSNIEIDFSGQSAMNITGLIYAPRSYARYGGNGALTMVGQSIIGCIKFNGNGNIDITYEPDDTYIPPPRIALHE